MDYFYSTFKNEFFSGQEHDCYDIPDISIGDDVFICVEGVCLQSNFDTIISAIKAGGQRLSEIKHKPKITQFTVWV